MSPPPKRLGLAATDPALQAPAPSEPQRPDAAAQPSAPPDPQTHPQEHPGEDPGEDPVADGRLRWGEATPEQQERAREGLTRRLGAYMNKGRPRLVITDNLHTMVSIKRGHDVFTFRIHHMFFAAPPRVLRALARYAEKHDREAAQIVRKYIDVNEVLIRTRTGPRPITCDVEGRHHNLQEIFDELNARYFDGKIKARITWGPRAKRKKSRESIKLGSYTYEDELIRIHPVLDADDVPRFFVGWIVYHEMLHEVHDMPVVEGRRCYHPPEFRRAEARYERYAESVLWERVNLHRLLER